MRFFTFLFCCIAFCYAGNSQAGIMKPTDENEIKKPFSDLLEDDLIVKLSETKKPFDDIKPLPQEKIFVDTPPSNSSALPNPLDYGTKPDFIDYATKTVTFQPGNDPEHPYTDLNISGLWRLQGWTVFEVIPEPSTYIMIVMGLLSLVFYRKRFG